MYSMFYNNLESASLFLITCTDVGVHVMHVYLSGVKKKKKKKLASPQGSLVLTFCSLGSQGSSTLLER